MSFSQCIIVLLAYCIGAIPFGLVVSRRSGIDIRTQGSKNIGATNVARLLGKKYGAMTLAGDLLKGLLPIWLAALLVQGQPNEHLVLVLCGAATVLGHMFPVYLGFKGGKGVATALGLFLYLSPLAIVGCLLVFLGAVGVSGFVSLGSLLASASMIAFLILLHAPLWKVVLACGIVTMIWLKHHQNIDRLLDGSEKSWKKSCG
ncbi:glycerol-3-phosphate 1-O-acyltransferase PlsY [Desulfogranum mediterraneum]|uniref:glycerol-3-phosphate 1-O-acyltransferase PlsY n=1 Tax=Desulfogranum mediterraneum TaxID=160661 RepID=UPI00042988F3|nr:glycerol-3-phosphate 1-O-acyltransferase PlsY [Desulfogranum mediterraneum]